MEAYLFTGVHFVWRGETLIVRHVYAGGRAFVCERGNGKLVYVNLIA